MSEHYVVDIHQHSGPWPFPGRWGGVAENLRLMTRCGIDKAIISSTRAVVQDMIAGNAELAESIARYPQQLYAYVTTNPTCPGLSSHELERYQNNPQFVGVKIHTNYSGCAMDDPRLDAMLDIVEEWGKPLLIHTIGASAVASLRVLAGQHPDLPIIMAHAGGDAWRQSIAAAVDRPNLYLDFAKSTPYSGVIARALETLGATRLVFGTDATLFDPLYTKARFDAVEMSPPDRDLIMGGNAMRLFELAPCS